MGERPKISRLESLKIAVEQRWAEIYQNIRQSLSPQSSEGVKKKEKTRRFNQDEKANFSRESRVISRSLDEMVGSLSKSPNLTGLKLRELGRHELETFHELGLNNLVSAIEELRSFGTDFANTFEQLSSDADGQRAYLRQVYTAIAKVREEITAARELVF